MLEVLHIPAFGGFICLTLTLWTVCSARWFVSLGRGRAKRRIQEEVRLRAHSLVPRWFGFIENGNFFTGSLDTDLENMRKVRSYRPIA